MQGLKKGNVRSERSCLFSSSAGVSPWVLKVSNSIVSCLGWQRPPDPSCMCPQLAGMHPAGRRHFVMPTRKTWAVRYPHWNYIIVVLPLPKLRRSLQERTLSFSTAAIPLGSWSACAATTSPLCFGLTSTVPVGCLDFQPVPIVSMSGGGRRWGDASDPFKGLAFCREASHPMAAILIGSPLCAGISSTILDDGWSVEMARRSSFSQETTERWVTGFG